MQTPLTRLLLQGAEQGSAQERTRTAITAALRTKLVDLAASFQELRQRLQADYRSAQLPPEWAHRRCERCCNLKLSSHPH